MTYSASLDNLAKGVTIGITVLFAGIIIGQFSIIKETDSTIPIYTLATLLIIYLGAFLFRPIDYSLSHDGITIRRLIKDVKIAREQIVSVEVINSNKIEGSIRTFGVGGLFGYYGKFANFELGSTTWYATRRQKTVLIKTINNKKIILTPDEPEKFVADFGL